MTVRSWRPLAFRSLVHCRIGRSSWTSSPLHLSSRPVLPLVPSALCQDLRPTGRSSAGQGSCSFAGGLRAGSWVLALFALVALMSCAHERDRLDTAARLSLTPVKERLPPDVLPPSQVLGPGDRLQIQLANQTAMNQECLVGPDGRIYVEPIGEMTVAGLDTAELTKRLVTEFSKTWREPLVEVHILVTASKQAIVLGQVATPGPIPLRGGERVLDLLARVGGTARSQSLDNSEGLADLSGAMFVRGHVLLPVDFQALLQRGDQRHNIRVHPDDYLYIPAGFERQIYVLGDVNQPGILNLRDARVLTQAITLAGGYNDNAYFDELIVIRGSRSKPMAAKVDLKGILEGRLPDVVLIPGDILYMPGKTSESPRVLFDQFNKSFLSAAAGDYAGQIYREIRK